jgi:cell division protein FtsB
MSKVTKSSPTQKPKSALSAAEADHQGAAAGSDGGGRPLIRRRGAASEQQRTRSLGWLILTVVALLVVTMGFAGARSYQDLQRARARVAVLEGQIGEARMTVEDLRLRAGRLQDDPETIERAIRDELGLVSSSELVIVLPPEPPGEPPSP